MTAGTASCTVTVAGLTNQATQVNASCVGNPAAFTNLAASVTTTGITNGSTDQCLVVNRANATVAKTFGAGSINDTAATTLVFTLTNSGSNPAQSGITVGDTLPTGLAINSATPAVAYSAGCAGPATATYTAGTRVLSGITGVTMSAGTASCTVTVAGLTNQATQVNASCVGNPAGFTNLATSGHDHRHHQRLDRPVPGGEPRQCDGGQDLRRRVDQRHRGDDARLHAHQQRQQPGAVRDHGRRHAAHGSATQLRDSGGRVLGGLRGAGDRHLHRWYASAVRAHRHQHERWAPRAAR